MTLFAGNRNGHNRWGRTVLAAVLMAWLTTALQPCLMAMEVAPEPPDAKFAPMAGHEGHSAHEDTTTIDHCPHCPAADAQSNDVCGTVLQADCDQSPAYYDARTTSVKVNDTLSDMPVGLGPPSVVLALHGNWSKLPGLAVGLSLPGNSPSLRILYGIYLI